MPTPSFASAAAGNTSDASGNRSRSDSSGIGDWSRRPNGATQTFRRTSLATNPSASSQRDTTATTPSAVPQSAGAYVPPHLSAVRNGPVGDTRYTKQQLLDLFKDQRDSGDLEDGLAELSVGDWHANLTNGSSSRWNRKDEPRTEGAAGPDICWLREGGSEPIGLFDMTDEEQELFSTTVNAPVKGPTQHPTREGSQRESIGRKSSFSQGSGSIYGLTSPTTTKPMTRRREGSESFSRDAIASPTSTTSRFFRDDNPPAEPPPSLTRRRTDYKDSVSSTITEEQDKDSTPTSAAPFGSLKRTSTQPFGSALNGPSSPWSAGPSGSFGNFAFGGSGNTGLPNEKRPGFSRGESRFRGLMSKESSEDVGLSVKERPSHGSLHKVDEVDASRRTPSTYDELSRRPMTGATDPYSVDAHPSGSAALGGESPNIRGTGYGTPQRQDPYSDQNYSRFGMGPDRSGFGEGSQYGQPQYTGQMPGSSAPEEPSSPTLTNPYQSPENRTSQLRSYENDAPTPGGFHLPGLGGFGGDMGQESQGDGQSKGRFPSSYDPRSMDVNQNPPGGSSRGFPGLGGLGGLGRLNSTDNWATGAIGTPSRERAAFENFETRSPATLQSPSLANLGNSSFNQPIGSGVGRSSRMGSLFPAAMQEQMRGTDQGFFGTPGERDDVGDDPMSSRQLNVESSFRGIASPDESMDIPSEQGMTGFSQQFSADQDKAQLHSVSGQLGYGQSQQQPSIGQGGRMASSAASASSNQPPAPQQKTMVMPDRIRWIYRDPQGNTQGPWSGLEMHDWYRAGFFSPELLVKKVEDPDYEPLAQLIRRIGNSREPFLVPQIGIPGPPSGAQTGASPWPNQQQPQPPPQTTSVSAAPSAQPPFASSFPSFGTTLTAEQQNALERRKQEEQYLMARQKEHLAQQQFMMKQMQLQTPSHGMHQQLQHHSSAHSLHSQPSHGSISSPSGAFAGVQSPMSYHASLPGGLDSAMPRLAGQGSGAVGSGLDSLSGIKEEEIPGILERMNLEHGGPSSDMSPLNRLQYAEHEERIAAALGDRARLEREQADDDLLRQHTQDNYMDERLQQFRNIRGQDDERRDMPLNEDSLQREQKYYDDKMTQEHLEALQNEVEANKAPETPLKGMSLTEQVQKAASAKHSPSQEIQSPWGKVDSGVPMPFPPPQSSSPLPAPAARRGGPSVADALAAESSQSASPSVETPSTSIAPWAKEASEAQKQPSLREIQEAEARRAAKQEELLIAARRAALDKEIMSQPPPPAPGLPSSSTWGKTESPLSPSSANSAVPWGTKVATPGKVTSSAASKKTLQQIQKEEEARKQKAAASASSNATMANSIGATAQAMSSGKRYADLASKVTAGASGTGAWTTVGAGGKVKGPTTPTGAPTLTRTASGSIPSAAAAAAAASIRTKSTATPPALPVGLTSAKATAQEEFKRWAVGELRPDLSKGVQVDDFVANLLSLGTDVNIITEAVHSVSSTLDSRHFAEEFVRRRGLAEKGKVDPTSSSSQLSEPKSAGTSGSGGWSEVARKGPTATTPKEESSGYKIVAAKKKGGKK